MGDQEAHLALRPEILEDLGRVLLVSSSFTQDLEIK
jgi:hypothetical protein